MVEHKVQQVFERDWTTQRRAFQQKQQQKQRRQFPFEVTVVAILLQRHTSPFNLYVTSETQMSFWQNYYTKDCGNAEKLRMAKYDSLHIIHGSQFKHWNDHAICDYLMPPSGERRVVIHNPRQQLGPATSTKVE